MQDADTSLPVPGPELGAFFARLFANAPVSLAVLEGPEHRFTMANPAYENHVGHRPLLGLTIREAFPELAGQGFYELLDQVYATGKAYINRYQRLELNRGRGVEETYVDFVYEPMLKADGQVTGILVVAFDATELVRGRIEAESQRLRAEASEHQLQLFVDHLPELAWTARPDGFIDYYNQRWYAYTGTTFADMQGWGWQRLHDPALLPMVMARWQHSLVTGEPFEMEFTLLGADGVPRWFLTRVMPLRDPAGKIVRWFGINTNIDTIRSVQALTDAMTAQSLEVQQALLELRAEKERAEQRVAELEARLRQAGA